MWSDVVEFGTLGTNISLLAGNIYVAESSFRGSIVGELADCSISAKTRFLVHFISIYTILKGPGEVRPGSCSV